MNRNSGFSGLIRPRIFAGLPLVLMLFACQSIVSNDELISTSDEDQSKPRAIIIFSTEAKHSCWGMDTELRLVRSGTNYFDNVLFTFSVDSAWVKGDLGGHPGHVYEIPIPAGNYYFTPYRSGMNRSYLTMSIPRYDFNVTPGETVYLGNFYLDLKTACDPAISTSFRDEEGRDMDLLGETNPEFDRSSVAKRIPIFSGLVQSPAR